ncbi:MAG TPA: hypothetical protein ENN80_02785 [Candidatus Hydrogenedentes bacterium]|nr:hypothetical protein [Candidatus Hydrogenedentota bacterium]
MQLGELVTHIGAEVIVPGASPAAPVCRVYGGDKISELLAAADEETLLVTNLSNAAVVHVAALMDAPGICLTGRDAVGPDLVAAAERHGKALFLTVADMAETCARAAACLAGSKTEEL